MLLSAKISYCREWHSGLHHLKLGYWGIYPSATYNVTNNFSVFAAYAQSFGDRGYMRGGSYLTRFSSNLRAGAQYFWKDLYISLQVNSVLRKNGWVKNWMDIPNYRDYRYVNRPGDGRYVMLSVSYNLNFGKKINRGDDIRYFRKDEFKAYGVLRQVY